MGSYRSSSKGVNAICISAMFLLQLTGAWGQSTETVLYAFTGGDDGAVPTGSLIFDSAGNLYGTTLRGGGGVNENGVVFELSPVAGDNWKENVIHAFGGHEGIEPFAGLTFDASGNLYGTTLQGGSGEGNGTVFKLTPSAGTWQLTYYSFNQLDRGSYPTAGVVFDASGNLYGTTQMGGLVTCDDGYGCGTIFRLSPGSRGGVSEKVHGFSDNGHISFPESPLTFDAAGRLFGTGLGGGRSNLGIVFELTPTNDGKWTASTVHSFSGGADGAFPAYGGLVFDMAGNFYGTASGGGYEGGACATYGGCGVVFEMTPSLGGWTETVLYTFTGGIDGGKPTAGVVLDASGNLYGTTPGGGIGSCTDQGIPGCGVVFELTPTASGWTQRVLWSFSGDNDGSEPIASVILDGAGNLYGTTQAGGTYNSGVVFEVTP
jgi:uncharacterized repeat protein (TIGR03803 family)